MVIKEKVGGGGMEEMKKNILKSSLKNFLGTFFNFDHSPDPPIFLLI